MKNPSASKTDKDRIAPDTDPYIAENAKCPVCGSPSDLYDTLFEVLDGDLSKKELRAWVKKLSKVLLDE